MTVYQGTPVPSGTSTGQPFNYFVPIIKLADAYIDYYQVQAYNNWYDGLQGGSTAYLIDVYLNWRNIKSPYTNTAPIANFAGVAGNKILMGVIASTNAGGSGSYASPANINSFKCYLTKNGYTMKGFMIWDSYWDTLNKYMISNEIKKTATCV